MINYYIFLFIILIFFHNIINCDRLSDSLFEYEFLRDDCLNGKIPDITSNNIFGDLVVDLYGEGTNHVYCLEGNGISTTGEAHSGEPLVSSTYDSTDFINSIETEGTYDFTLEMWLEHDDKAAPSSHTFLKFGIRNITTDYNEGNQCSEYMNLGFSESLKTLSVDYWESVSQCGSRYSASDYVDDVITHVVIVVSGSTITFYRNNVTAGSSSTVADYPTVIPQWNTNFIMELFSQAKALYDNDEVWQGTFYLLAWYNYAFDASDVDQNYKAGLPNSKPRSYDFVATIKEDGEKGTHIDDPIFYENETPYDELINITLSVYDADDDPEHPNYVVDNPPMEVYITTYPQNGELIRTNGTTLSSNDLPIKLFDDEYNILFRPEKDTFSSGSSADDSQEITIGDNIYSSFEFYAKDGITGEISNTSTAEIIVTSINDPPVPFEGNETVFQGKVNVLTLSGTDVDSNKIKRAYITELPPDGNLYVVYSLETSDDDSVSTLNISTTPIELNDNGRFQLQIPDGSTVALTVAYEYTGAENTVSFAKTGVLGRDYFKYKLEDNDDGLSREGKLNIDVKSALTAYAGQDYCKGKNAPCTASAYEIQEDADDEDSVIYLYGIDNADDLRDIQFVIDSLPTYGDLKDPTTGTILDIGDIITVTSGPSSDYGPVEIYYDSISDYFNDPQQIWNGSTIPNIEYDYFDFHIQVDGNSNIISASVSQRLDVLNVNDEGSITIPSTVWTDQAQVEIYIENIRYQDDVDLDTDLVVCQIEVIDSRGTITLNPEYQDKVYFNGDVCDNVGCKNDATGNALMKFVAIPSNIDGAIRNMTFIGQFANEEMEIQITIYDGANGKCIDDDIYDDYGKDVTIRDGCYSTTNIFFVTTTSFASISDSGYSGSSGLPIQIWGAAAGGICLFGCICCIFIIRRCSGGGGNGKRKGKDPSFEVPVSSRHPGETGERDSLTKNYGGPPVMHTSINKSHIEMNPSDPEKVPANWKKFRNEGGQEYYYNSVTRRTTWTAPNFI